MLEIRTAFQTANDDESVSDHALLEAHRSDASSAIVQICGQRLLVDSDQVDRLKTVSWSHYQTPSGIVFQTRALEHGSRIKMTLARFVVRPPTGTITFRQHNSAPWDYRISAFQVGDHQVRQTQQGKRKPRTSSKFKGVSRNKDGQWRASIRPDGRSIYLGVFATEVEAAAAYNKAAQIFFGEQAYQNHLDPIGEHDRTQKHDAEGQRRLFNEFKVRSKD